MVFLRSVARRACACALWLHGATKYQVPEVVWRGSEECVRGYLRALFQADGTVQRLEPQPRAARFDLRRVRAACFKTCSMLLANFGIFCRILKRRDAEPANASGRYVAASGNTTVPADYELIIDGRVA